MSQRLDPRVAPPAPTGWKSTHQSRQSLCSPCVHHVHPACRPSVLRHPRELAEDPAGDCRKYLARDWLLGRIFYRKWIHPASAYITGISVGILIRSPAFWPYALCSAISITSKYVLRVKGRHLWNPSNFGISVMLFLAGDTVASLSIQWGNYLWPMLVIWALGSIIIWRLRRFHITGDVCRLVHRVRVAAKLDNRQPLAIGDRAHHGTDVPTLYLLHDHRSKNHGSLEELANASSPSRWPSWRWYCAFIRLSMLRTTRSSSSDPPRS